MRKMIDLWGMRRSRRQMLGCLGGAAALGATTRLALAQDEQPSEAAVLHDPDIPVAGNPEGDIAIVEWFDYQCPYCRKLEPELRQVVQDDGKVRLVLKDWPILGPVSVTAARIAVLEVWVAKAMVVPIAVARICIGGERWALAL